MKISGIVWLEAIVEKLASKHGVAPDEVAEVFANQEDLPKFRFVENGTREGENVYMALGQTEAGRHLAVLFIHKKTHQALVVSARDMAAKERKLYERK